MHRPLVRQPALRRDLVIANMNLKLRTLSLSIVALMVGMATLAAPAQALSTIQACTPPNPDAWVNACVTLNPASRTVNYQTYNSNYQTTRVCPINNICVDAPVVTTLIKPWSYTVQYYTVTPTASVHPDNVVDDVCDVLGIVCKLTDAISTSSSMSTEMPNGLVLEGFTLDENGNLSEVALLQPDGEIVFVPIVA